MKIIHWLIGCVNDAIHWSFAPKDYKDRCKAICNGDYYITDQKMFKSKNKWNDGLVPSRDLDDMPPVGRPTGKKIGPIYIGDVVGDTAGDRAVQIEITGFNYPADQESEVTAKVVKVGNYWSQDFEVGEELVLEYHGTSTTGVSWWTLVEPENKPWFDLFLADGRKYFEYRSSPRSFTQAY